MRKKIALIAAMALLLLGYCAPTFAQTTQTFNISSHLPSSPLGISLVTPNLQPSQIFSPVILTTNTTGGAAGYTYLWTPSTGLNDPTLPSPELTYDTTVTSYTVTVTDANGCTSDAVLTIDFSTSAAGASALPVSLSIFPNPNDGSFHLSLKGQPLDAPLQVFVSDVVGREVYREGEFRFTGQLDRDIDLSALGSGIYFLSLRAGNAHTTEKLVIK